MLAISPGQVTPQVLSLFDPTKPTMPRAFNVLEGLNRGQILLEDAARPSWAVVREAVYGTLYFGGAPSTSLVAFAVKHFREIGEVGIGCWLDDPFNEMIPPGHQYDGRTLYFPERQRDRPPVNARLPLGFTMIPRDEAWFKQSFDYESTLRSFDSVEEVLRHTLGIVIVDGPTLACEAATGAPTHGRIEVGVTTAEAYRGRGLATLACVRLIDECEARGLDTWWDCAKQNIPSRKLAQRLGYVNEREYRYVWWQKSQESAPDSLRNP